MTTTSDLTIDDVEAHTRAVAERLTAVHDGECLYCYLIRMLDEFGCGAKGHPWTTRWVAARAKHDWVLPWVKRNGGCCCDCEVIINVFDGRPRTERHRRLQCDASYEAAQRHYGECEDDGDCPDGD